MRILFPKLEWPRFLIAFSVLIILSSCLPQKKILYLQEPDKGNAKTEFAYNYIPYKLRIGDELMIQVNGTDEKTTKLFNLNTFGAGNQLIYQVGGYLWSYTVDDSGYIMVPTVGKLAVKGLSVDEAQAEIQRKVNEIINYAVVVVKLANFKITVLGEVKNPGVKLVNDDKISLLEALGLAGDLADYGNRNHILVLRENENGKQLKVLDITDRKFIESDYYYLYPNDVVYVEPLGAKAFGLRNFQLGTYVSLTSSLLTTILLIINFSK